MTTEAWYAAPTLGLDAAGADKDIVTHLEAAKYPDLKTALRSGIAAPKGPDLAPFEKVGLKGDTAFQFDPDGADKDVAEFLAGKKPPDLRTLLRSHMEADRVARARNVFEKPEKGKESEWKGWADLGWVEDPSKYVFTGKARVPDGIEYDQAMEDELRLAAHEARVPLPVAERLRDRMVEAQNKRLDAVKAKGAGDTASLQAALDAKWGADKARNLEIAKRAMGAFGVKLDDSKELERIVGSARLVEMFHAIGARIGEQNLPAGDGGSSGLPGSESQLRAELNRLHGDKDFMAAFNDERHPQHKDRVAQREAIIAKLAALQQKAA
jgi:hypothetical protein